MSEQSLLQRLQGADATRAAAAAIRGEPGNTTRAFTAERDLVQSWAAEHAELGTAADWRALESPADVVRCVEQAELPGAPYFMGLVFTFADARAAMRALDPDSVPSPLEVRDWAANMTRVHAGREPPEHAPGNTLAQTIAGYVQENVASTLINASFGPIVRTVAQIDDAIAVANIPVAQDAAVPDRIQALDAWCRLRVPAVAHADAAGAMVVGADDRPLCTRGHRSRLCRDSRRHHGPARHSVRHAGDHRRTSRRAPRVRIALQPWESSHRGQQEQEAKGPRTKRRPQAMGEHGEPLARLFT